MNLWNWFTATCIILIIPIICEIYLVFGRYRTGWNATARVIRTFSVFVALGTMHYPVYFFKLGASGTLGDHLRVHLVVIQQAIRLLGFDGGYLNYIKDIAALGVDQLLLTHYSYLAAFTYLLVPLLTFGAILTVFQNLVSHVRYRFHFWGTTHVFSELNEKSVSMAKSIMGETDGSSYWRRLGKRMTQMVVFTDVVRKLNEDSVGVTGAAKELKAVLFSKDLQSVKYRYVKWLPRRVKFYLISENEAEKTRHAGFLMNTYGDYRGVELYMFSDDIRSQLMVASKSTKRMKVTRINDIQSLVYHNLDVHGMRLFDNAREVSPNNKEISAVIVGLGKYGVEMMKALTWFCQLPGYRVKITAFDADKTAEDKFIRICPELMSSRYNGTYPEGDAQYSIKINGGVDVNSTAFYDDVAKIKDATYIFVALGDDALNLSVATRIRALSETVHYVGDHRKPDIETVVYDSNIRNTMSVKWDGEEAKCNPKGVVYFGKKAYDIHMIGDLIRFYNVNTLVNSDLINAGLKIHLRWGEESGFWKYEYNYRSSVARAIHDRLRIKMKLEIPGIEKPWDQRTDDEKLAIGLVEHVRWNAYMRTEGYRYSGSKDKATRNDLAKLHNNLVSVKELTDDELRKDA